MRVHRMITVSCLLKQATNYGSRHWA